MYFRTKHVGVLKKLHRMFLSVVFKKTRIYHFGQFVNELNVLDWTVTKIFVFNMSEYCFSLLCT